MTTSEQGTTGPVGGGPFRVLCVCEGNICRSPAAAFLLQAAMGPGVELTSAGTHAVVGAPVAPLMATLLHGRAVESDTFRARQLRPADLSEADLVLTMTRRQRARVVELQPGVVRRTFMLRELARLLGEADLQALPPGPVAGRLRLAARAAAGQRHYVADPTADDIADPYGLEETAYRRAFAAIADAVDGISRVLVPQG